MKYKKETRIVTVNTVWDINGDHHDPGTTGTVKHDVDNVPVNPMYVVRLDREYDPIGVYSIVRQRDIKLYDDFAVGKVAYIVSYDYVGSDGTKILYCWEGNILEKTNDWERLVSFPYMDKQGYYKSTRALVATSNLRSLGRSSARLNIRKRRK